MSRHVISGIRSCASRRWLPRGSASIFILFAAFTALVSQCQSQSHPALAVATNSGALLWSDPGDIKSHDLFYGPGGKQGEPKKPFSFVKEDKAGTNPKFDVRDSDDTVWKAKIGLEAQSETAAVRFLWAVGFVTNENYFVPEAQIGGLSHLKRGHQFVKQGGTVRRIRLQRGPKGEKKLGRWSWRHNPFLGSREFNGLRVMMALLNNWDLKDVNNAVYAGKQLGSMKMYEVSDVGSTFGRTGESYSNEMSKNNLRAYQKSKFITKVTRDQVNFNVPTHLPFAYVFNLPLFISYQRQRWISQHIPRSDVKWIGSLLSQLSPEQIRDAFRAAGYTPEQVEAFAAVVEKRIGQLSEL